MRSDTGLDPRSLATHDVLTLRTAGVPSLFTDELSVVPAAVLVRCSPGFSGSLDRMSVETKAMRCWRIYGQQLAPWVLESDPNGAGQGARADVRRPLSHLRHLASMLIASGVGVRSSGPLQAREREDHAGSFIAQVRIVWMSAHSWSSAAGPFS